MSFLYDFDFVIHNSQLEQGYDVVVHELHGQSTTFDVWEFFRTRLDVLLC